MLNQLHNTYINLLGLFRSFLFIAAAAHNAQTRHVGKGSQRTALLAVTGGNGDHGGVGGVVDGVSHRVIKVIGDGDPHHFRGSFKGDDKHKHAGHAEGQGGQQHPRASLACQNAGALDELTHNQVGSHNQQGGHQLKDGQEPGVQLQHIGEILVQKAGEYARGQQRPEGADEVANQHLRQLHVRGLHQRVGQRGVPKPGLLFTHDVHSCLF